MKAQHSGERLMRGATLVIAPTTATATNQPQALAVLCPPGQGGQRDKPPDLALGGWQSPHPCDFRLCNAPWDGKSKHFREMLKKANERGFASERVLMESW